MKLPKHYMLDIESFGTKPGSVVKSIGAVEFSIGDGITRTFHTTICVNSCLDAGLTVNGDTLKWWFSQPPEAIKSLYGDEVTLRDALEGFTAFIADGDWENARTACVWGNGAAFDNVLVRAAYDSVGMRHPWDFRGDRCYRQVMRLLPPVEVLSTGVHHNALDDAIWQASKLIATLKAANLPLQ